MLSVQTITTSAKQVLQSRQTTSSNSLNRQLNILTCFPENYKGSLHVLISSSDSFNISKLRPIKLGKLFCITFMGIQSIEAIGSQRVQIPFSDISYANDLFSLPFMILNDLFAAISTIVLNNLSIIRLDSCVSGENVWEENESFVNITSFPKIIINREEQTIPSRLVKCTF